MHSRSVLVIPLVAALVAVAATVVPAGAVTPPPAPGTVASANPADTTPNALNGTTRAFAQIGDTVYVGGSFTQVRAAGSSTVVARNYLFAYDRTSGAISSVFTPNINGLVNSLAVVGNTLYVGGNFTTADGVARRAVAALDGTTGRLVTTFNAAMDYNVRSIAVSGSWLYLGGAFHYVGARSHALLARVNLTTGAVDQGFQINADVPRYNSPYVSTIAVSPDGKWLVFGGNFTQVNGQARWQIGLADVSGPTAVLSSWQTDGYVANCYSSPNAFDTYLMDVAFDEASSYFVVAAAGGRGNGSTDYCDSTTRWDPTATGGGQAPTWIDWTGTDSVTAVVVSRGVVYNAGHFRWQNNSNGNDAPGGGAIDRYGLAALDPANGMPVAWNPSRSPGGNLPPGGVSWGPQVWTLFAGTDGIYAGYDSDGLGYEYHGRLGMFPWPGGHALYQPANVSLPARLVAANADGTATASTLGAGGVGAPSPIATGVDFTTARSPFVAGRRLFWGAPDNVLHISYFNGTTASGGDFPQGSNAFFGTAGLTGAFYQDGKMFYTSSGSDQLRYRYLGVDAVGVVGSWNFTANSSIPLGAVRAMTYAGGSVYFTTGDGNLYAVAFAADAITGSPSVVSGPTVDGRTWNPVALFATN
ncbi:hypothetical protein ACXR2U_09405 [Jatrophihabitans sp. YIM 134969]